MLLYDKVSEADVWNYWKSLFPEVKKEEELRDMLNVCGSFNEKEIAKFWNEHKGNHREFMVWLSQQEEFICSSEKWDRFIEGNHMDNMFYPLLLYKKDQIKRLLEAVKSSRIYGNEESILKSLMEEICLRLREISIRTFITEIHVEKTEKRLKGDDKRKRYIDYTDRRWRSKSYIKKFYSEYQELLDMQMEVLKHTVFAIVEMIERIQMNYPELMKKFFGEERNVLIENIQLGLGDSHRGGRTVASITFTNGKKLIYKPRNMGVEIGFLRYSKAMNAGMSLREKALYEAKLLDFGEYGFIEYISQKECEEEQQLTRYYYRSGVLMAMLYSLNGKDIHHENLIAHGEYPVMIDLEALFHSKLQHKNIENEKTAYEAALDSINDSVYSIGLLPMHLTNPYDKGSSSVDISGFGGEKQQVSPFKILMIQNKETDEICLEKSDYMIQPQKNIAKYQGVAANASDYRDFIMQGFEDAYLFIMKNKKDLAASIKEWFGGVNTRVIYRPTYLYTKLMFTSSHPDFMRVKAHRYVLLHRMAYKVKKQENQIVVSEIKDMMIGDVPFFEVNIHTGVMRNSAQEALPLFFQKTPYELVEEKINHFSMDDLQKQKDIIDHAFLSKNVEDYRHIWLTNSKWSKSPEVSIPYLQMAEAIGKKLLREAKEARVHGEWQLSWINFMPVGDDHINYELLPVEGDLYSGTSGIGLFFLYLWKASGKKTYLDAAYACMHGVIHRMQKIDEYSSYLIGPFNGLSGYIYVFSKFYLEAKDENMLGLVEEGLLRMKKIYHQDRNYDIISGSAGAIKVCISLQKRFQGRVKDLAEEMIQLLTSHLIAQKKVWKDGSIAWYSGLNDHVYSGYAHGSCGIEEALASVYERYPSDELKEVLDRSHAFVKKMYVKEKHNWKTVLGRNDYSYGWCHGAPGILYSQIKQWKSRGGVEKEKEELLQNLKNMKRHVLGNNICYCHGDIGNIELIGRIGGILEDEGLKRECECTYQKLALKFPDYIKERPLLPYGLMLGMSGIGYSLLVALSQDVPSILEFD